MNNKKMPVARFELTTSTSLSQKEFKSSPCGSALNSYELCLLQCGTLTRLSHTGVKENKNSVYKNLTIFSATFSASPSS